MWMHSDNQESPMMRNNLVKSTNCSLVSLVLLALLALVLLVLLSVALLVLWLGTLCEKKNTFRIIRRLKWNLPRCNFLNTVRFEFWTKWPFWSSFSSSINCRWWPRTSGYWSTAKSRWACRKRTGLPGWKGNKEILQFGVWRCPSGQSGQKGPLAQPSPMAFPSQRGSNKRISFGHFLSCKVTRIDALVSITLKCFSSDVNQE